MWIDIATAHNLQLFASTYSVPFGHQSGRFFSSKRWRAAISANVREIHAYVSYNKITQRHINYDSRRSGYIFRTNLSSNQSSFHPVSSATQKANGAFLPGSWRRSPGLAPRTHNHTISASLLNLRNKKDQIQVKTWLLTCMWLHEYIFFHVARLIYCT